MPDRIKMYTVRGCFGGIKCAFVRFTVMEAEKQSEVPKPFDKALFPRMVYLALGTGGDCSLERGYCVIIVGSRLRGLGFWETVPNCELPDLLPAVGSKKTADG